MENQQSARDVDQIIRRIVSTYPAVKVRQLTVRHPGADDDGLWFFEQPTCKFEVQIESAMGKGAVLNSTTLHNREPTIIAVEYDPLHLPFANTMPTAGLCRANDPASVPEYFPVVGDAA